MPNQPNLLALVRQHLITHGESYQWVTMGAQSEKIGLAYLPVTDTEIPCSFMFTELKHPSSLVFELIHNVTGDRKQSSTVGYLISVYVSLEFG